MKFDFNPIFIDRKNELDNLIQVLNNSKIIIIEGEQGVGKSSILDNLHNKLKKSSSPYFVRYYSNDKALIGKSFSESSIFVILLEDILNWINENYHIKGKLQAEKEKVKEVTIKFLKKRGTKIAKKIARDLLDKIGLSGLVDIAEEFGEEYSQQKSIFEMSEEYIDETKGKELLFTSMEN
jgi:ABC-type phosphate/phosphonate transport system ATPase subunit